MSQRLLDVLHSSEVSETEVVNYAKQVAAAMHYLHHKLDVLHCDLAARNISFFCIFRFIMPTSCTVQGIDNSVWEYFYTTWTHPLASLILSFLACSALNRWKRCGDWTRLKQAFHDQGRICFLSSSHCSPFLYPMPLNLISGQLVLVAGS